MPTLIAESGPLAGQRIDVEHELTVGRVDGDLVIEDAKLSRRHAIFRVVGDGLEAEDLGSTNGTFVGDRRIDGPTRLRDGEQVRLGTSQFTVEIPVAVIEATQIDRTVIDRPAPDRRRSHRVPSAGDRSRPLGRDRGPRRPPGHPRRRSRRAASPPPPPRRAATAAASRTATRPPPAPPPPRARPRPRRSRGGAGPGRSAGSLLAAGGQAQGGLATRSWVPVAASYGSAIAVAIALIIYFVTR